MVITYKVLTLPLLKVLSILIHKPTVTYLTLPYSSLPFLTLSCLLYLDLE